MQDRSAESEPEEPAGQQPVAMPCACPSEAGAATCELRATSGPAACALCGEGGKPVDTLTVKALLAVALTQLRSTDYRFCRTQACPVVYFSADGDQRFVEDEVREVVYQKRPNDEDVFVCYCFRHTAGSMRRDLRDKGTTGIIEAISTGIRLGQCACDIRNPQGSCCLGNVRALVQRLETGGRA